MKRKLLFIFILSFIGFFLFEDGLLLYNKLNKSHTILGQKLSGMFLTNLTRNQAMVLINGKYVKNAPLRLIYKGRIFEVHKEDIGARIDYQKTLDQVYNMGKTENFFQNILMQNKALLGQNDSKIQTALSKPLLLVKVSELENEINVQPKPQMPDFSGDMRNTVPQQNGIKVISSQLLQIITANIFNPPSKPITIPTQIIMKKYHPYDLNEILKQAAAYTSKPLSITSAGVIFTLSPRDLLSLLTVSEQPDPVSPKKTIITLALDHTKLSHMLYPYANQVEAASHAEFNEHETYVAIYSQFYTNTRQLIDVATGQPSQTKVLGVSTSTAPNSPEVVYLTFDDGPNLIYHPLVLDILKEKGVHATFYLVGSNSKLYASMAKRTINEGHIIGDHSLTHAYLAKLLPNQIIDEIKTTQDILNGLGQPGKKITLFRPPYGGTNKLVESDATMLGLKQMLWTVDPKDWSEPSTNELVNRIINNVQNGSVVLMHSNHFATIKALPLIIDKLRTKGYEFRVQQ